MRGVRIFFQTSLANGAALPTRPASLGERDELWSILEMRAVEVIPFGAPDEAVALEDFADGAGHAVLPDDLAVLAFRPFPVVGEFGIDVDRRAERVHR